MKKTLEFTGMAFEGFEQVVNGDILNAGGSICSAKADRSKGYAVVTVSLPDKESFVQKFKNSLSAFFCPSLLQE